MKIGLSLSRCVRDIVDGEVDIHDVLVVIARTDFDPRNAEQWKEIWEGYGGGHGVGSIWSNPEWSCYSLEDEDRVRSVLIELIETGKLHQPRQFGAHPRRMPYYWLETVLPDSELERNPSVKLAWEKFQMVAGLSNINMDKDYR